MNAKQTVFVGMSGGVDSSVAALRLQQQGYRVVGVFIKVWQPDWLDCNWEQERLDAMRVAAHLDIPFLTCDAEATYRDEVARYFIDEYKAGRTPNPDVMCNQHVKFGAFLDFAKKHGADYIATGHYAQKHPSSKGLNPLLEAELHRGVDQNKDQSYFLWTLSSEQLAATLFPIGDTPKEAIRSEATEARLPTADKKDSQGICFLGQIDIPDFLAHYIDLAPGPVLDLAGHTIGEHRGAFVYTMGQRHGFRLDTSDTKRPHMYVVAKDIAANTITVSSERVENQSGSTLELAHTVLRAPLTTGAKVTAQFRYRQTPIPVTITHLGEQSLTLTLDTHTDTPAAGQSCVLYDGTHCLGGGIIV